MPVRKRIRTISVAVSAGGRASRPVGWVVQGAAPCYGRAAGVLRSAFVVIACVLMTGAWPLPALAGGLDPMPDTLSSLDELRWEHRVLLVSADGPAQDAIKALREHADEVTDRDLIWFVLHREGVVTNFQGDLLEGFVQRVKERLGEGDRVLLIGKDGGTKLRSTTLEPGIVFSLIDTMPMRQREMRQR